MKNRGGGRSPLAYAQGAEGPLETWKDALIQLDPFQDCRGVPFRFHQWPDLFDLAVLADQERTADDAHVSPAHELFLLPRAELLKRFMLGIAEQWKIEFVFFPEGGERLYGIGAHPQDGDAALVKFLFCVTKLGRLDRSTRSVCFRKEKEQYALAPEILQGQFRALVGLQGKIRSLGAYLDHWMTSFDRADQRGGRKSGS